MRRSYRTLSTLIAAVSFGALSDARADDCATLKRIMADVPNKFATIKGSYLDVEEGDKYYRANVSLSALHECVVVEAEDGRLRVGCSNGAGPGGAEFRAAPLDAADSLLASCAFRVRDTQDIGRGKRAGKIYMVITDDKQLVQITTSSFDGGPRKRVRIYIANP
jgi:hypothetical protein